MLRRSVVAILLVARGAAAEPVQLVRPADIVPAIRGRVIDTRGKPIAGATVSIAPADAAPRAAVAATAMPSSARAAITDAQGGFTLVGAPSGTGLVVLRDGYAAGLATASPEVGDIVLYPEAHAGETITITGEAPPPVQGAGRLARADLERLPGGGNDAIRALDAMPGVVSFPFPLAASGIAIRGSSPQDSRVLIDGFEVPRLYHDIGFRSIIPAEALEQIDYIPGGFDVAFGRASSGIVQVTTRPGSDATGRQAEVSSSDGGVLAQGAFARGRYLLAFRRSVIDQLLPAVLPEDLDLTLTTVPRYYDEQLRIDYAPSPRWSLRLSSVGSDDALALYTSHAEAPDKRLSERTRFVRVTTAARYHDGAWTADLALSGIAQQYELERGTRQHLSVTSPSATARAEVSRALGDVAGLTGLTWRLGGELAVSRSTVDVALPAEHREGEPVAPDDPMDTSVRFTGAIWTPDLAAWTAASASIDPRIRLLAGLRFDAFTRTGAVALQPRAELAIQLAPRVTARLSAGAYTRPPEHQTELLDPALGPERATQLVAGVALQPRDTVRLQASAYYTHRSQLITRVADGLGNLGRGTSYGAELFGTYHEGPWFGWLGYSYSHSTRVDAPGAPARLFDYDQPHSLNVAVSHSFGRWQLGARFRLYSGLPQTPVMGAVFDSDTNRYAPIYGAVNSDRAPIHHQLDLRLDRTWRWGPVKMTYFLDIQNVYANQSTLTYLYSYDYQQRTAFRALPLLPTAGLRGEL